MHRSASNKFAGWSIELVIQPPLDPALIAACDTCGVHASIAAYATVPDFLDDLLDHDWIHDPQAVPAPLDVIDSRVGHRGVA